jgi:signal peptidase
MRRVSGFALTLLVLAMAAIALAMVAVPGVAGVKAFTIDRNSMQRVIPFGSLEYAQPSDSYAVGDIVVFTHNGNTITHELVGQLPNPATGVEDATWFTTKGSENIAIDPWELDAHNIIGKVVWHAPLLGIATKVVATPTVAIFLVLLAAGLWWYSTGKPAQPSLGGVLEPES